MARATLLKLTGNAMINSNRLPGLPLLLACLLTSGCATTNDKIATPPHDNADAVVWLQSSAEYAAVTSGIYATAAAALEQIARSEPSRTGNMAVVMDIDETVLDNSRYQGQLVLDGASYSSDSWDDWIGLRSAPAVPGAADFIRTSQALGIHVAFITNRSCRTRPDSSDECPQHEDTLANLRAIGIDTAQTTLFLRGDRPSEDCLAYLTEAERDSGTWSSDKTSRRACVTVNRDIVLLFGDQLGDFTEVRDRPAGASGRELAGEFGDNWGTTWFMLPNPTYGGWRPRNPAEKRTQITGIDLE
jgi:acid phosphatase